MSMSRFSSFSKTHKNLYSLWCRYINDFTDAYLALINWPILNSDDDNGTRAEFFCVFFQKISIQYTYVYCTKHRNSVWVMYI